MTVSAQSITPQQLDELRRGGGVRLIDVRTPAEYREVHVEFAQNVPLDRLDAASVMAECPSGENKPLYLICHAGSRGRQACDKLRAAGLTNVVNVEGGTVACVASGLPVVRGQKTIALERQVRIAAGSIVLAGVLLAWFVHPALVWLSGFVGAGLVFSGVTDTCGMGLLLARMPWNQAGEPLASCSVPQNG